MSDQPNPFDRPKIVGKIVIVKTGIVDTQKVKTMKVWDIPTPLISITFNDWVRVDPHRPPVIDPVNLNDIEIEFGIDAPSIVNGRLQLPVDLDVPANGTADYTISVKINDMPISGENNRMQIALTIENRDQ